MKALLLLLALPAFWAGMLFQDHRSFTALQKSDGGCQLEGRK
jgi:hypothetical protein